MMTNRRHVALANRSKQGLKWKGKKTIKPGNVPRVKSLGMGKIGFSLDYSFIITILDI